MIRLELPHTIFVPAAQEDYVNIMDSTSLCFQPLDDIIYLTQEHL